MKNYVALLLLLLFVVLSPSCNKGCEETPSDALQDATITAYDLALCACCGGYFVDIDGTTWRFETLPPNSGIDLNPPNALPMKVRVRWQPKSPRCREDLIEILEIEKR